MGQACPTVTLTTHVLDDSDGALSFEFDGPTESYGFGTSDPSLTPGTCEVHYGDGTLLATYMGEVVFLSCSSQNGRWFLLPVWLGDLRQRSSGSFKTTSGQYAAYYSDLCTGAKWPPACGLVAPKGSMRVAIEAAQGSAASPPAFVTSDYERAVRVDVDFAAPDPTPPPWDDRKCEGSVGVHGTVRFALRANQYVVDKHASCLCAL